MEPVYLVILLALVEYQVFAGLVGRARGKHGVKAPAVSGAPEFERVHRVHQNTLEALIVFIPAIVIFGRYLGAHIAAAIGLVFIAARIIYAVAYIKDPEKRGPGAGLSGIALIVLVLGALYGVIRALV